MANSVEIPRPLVTAQRGREFLGVPSWQALALLILLGWLYASILGRLVLQWIGPNRDPNFEHGIFVPLFALFVVWQDRKKLQEIVPQPSWTGLPLLILGLCMLALGVLGAELFFSRTSYSLCSPD
jgi:Transmembrane exosortase (Exosortase_EpsH).